uniref:Uncharacterized protein LOC111132446 n=1 Tax=Crassostrea virginica TaxID=6565 RepID=A0A8B8E5T6_CRAVI|nr:uncharacterized protein LOC111132446 [Crassostrea virginica]
MRFGGALRPPLGLLKLLNFSDFTSKISPHRLTEVSVVPISSTAVMETKLRLFYRVITNLGQPRPIRGLKWSLAFDAKSCPIDRVLLNAQVVILTDVSSDVTIAYDKVHGRQSGRFIKGCAFHWTKAVWTHVQQLGLARTFRQREGTHYFIKQLMALPFLPWTHVHDVFRMMEDRAPPSLQPLTSYIKHQRMENPVFPVRSWSVYQFVVRTNNDVEGWHHRMNSKARGLPLPFYQLIPVLFREAEMVQSRIAATDLERDVRRTSHLVQQKIATASERYMNKEISSSAFLKICGSIYAAPFQ